MARDTEIPAAYLREALTYDPATGALTWLTRPREHFPTEIGWKKFNGHFASRPALTASDRNGYRFGKIHYAGRPFLLSAHRVIWALAHGRWPADQIDHINGDTADNRLENLREATHAENRHNTTARRKDNTSGFPGVFREKGKWAAQIAVNGRRRRLGRFDHPEAAFMAVCDAKARLHPFQPEHRGLTREQSITASYGWLLRTRPWEQGNEQ
jgi:hypothetical protein